MNLEIEKYPWLEELEKTLVHSLTTSFGLDFLLFKDKKGGEVDTIHNARQGIYATADEKEKYEQRDAYNSAIYHQHKNYKETGRIDKGLQEEGKLTDAYTGQILGLAEKGKRDLDHVIAAKEIHNDQGRFLAGLDTNEAGSNLANQANNLKSTHRSINRSKSDKSIPTWLDNLSTSIATEEAKLKLQKEQLKKLPTSTPAEKNLYQQQEAKIKNSEEKIQAFKNVDSEAMLQVDAEARAKYNQQINETYYTSSKFLTNTAKASGIAGLQMGTRQMLGLVLAEAWFELREQLPKILEEQKNKFSFSKFIEGITSTLKGIWQRVTSRFRDFLVSFRDGAFAGILSSVTTTIINIFFTTQRMLIKIIREVWGQLVKAIKILIFNPDNLGFVDLCKAVVSIISVGVATVMGTLVYAKLAPLFSLPFGSELAAFAGALVTGIFTLGFNYFLIYSEKAQKVWEFLNSIMPHMATVKKYQAINAELDRYLLEWAQLEFNLDVDELNYFIEDINACNDELEINKVLKQEIANRGIELPFEMGNEASTKSWLMSKIK